MEVPRLSPREEFIQRSKRVVPPVKKEGYNPEATAPSPRLVEEMIQIAEVAARAIYAGKAKYGVGLLRKAADPAMATAQALVALSFMLSPAQAITQMKRAMEGHK